MSDRGPFTIEQMVEHVYQAASDKGYEGDLGRAIARVSVDGLIGLYVRVLNVRVGYAAVGAHYLHKAEHVEATDRGGERQRTCQHVARHSTPNPPNP